MEDSGPGDAPQSRKRVESNGPKNRGHKPALDTRGFSAERVFTVIITRASHGPKATCWMCEPGQESKKKGTSEIEDEMSTQGPHTRNQKLETPHICKIRVSDLRSSLPSSFARQEVSERCYVGL